MKYVSIDLETSGLNYETDQILEFAAVIEDTMKNDDINSLPKFRKLILWDRIVGDIAAIKMNAAIINEINEEINKRKDKSLWAQNDNKFCRIDDLENEFKDFLIENNIDVTKGIICAGKNFGSFDRMFLLKVFKFLRISHRALDPGSMYVKKEDEKIPDFQICLDRAGIDKSTTHRALDDAIDTIKLIRYKIGDKG